MSGKCFLDMLLYYGSSPIFGVWMPYDNLQFGWRAILDAVCGSYLVQLTAYFNCEVFLINTYLALSAREYYSFTTNPASSVAVD